MLTVRPAQTSTPRASHWSNPLFGVIAEGGRIVVVNKLGETETQEPDEMGSNRTLSGGSAL